MDYSKFRFVAVVDWIEIEISTVTATNFHTVQEALKKILRLPEGKRPYVNPINKGAGGSATIFRLRIYDPKKHSDIAAILKKLEEHFCFFGKPRITAIEVAFDAYSKGGATHDELAQQVAISYHHLTRFVSKNRRLYKGAEESPKNADIPLQSLIKEVSEGWQIAIGNTKDDLYQHLYLKTTDDGELLPTDKHRARLEIRLQGDRVTSLTLDDWRNYSFQSLSKYFKFRMRKDEKRDPLDQLLADINPQIGERGKLKQSGSKRLYSKHTEADKLLNRKAFDSLRNLSKRWG